ncbi:4'-phosphopantetheinyl transferase family protein [Streptomyces sp. NPDC094038]|uniref:4'-phosphopantetheinyl transferase family protein n=1 Tax=Streptomyces sp. NPDC094038 TaxID=3366055 RepID=UPI00382C22D9
MSRTVQVWWTAPGAPGRRHHELLDDMERARLALLVDAADRARFLAGAALLRIAVGRLTGTMPEALRVDRSCAGCSLAHGRPVVRGSGIEVSVSHSGGLVAVAVGEAGPIGVDVQEMRGTAGPRLAAKVLTPVERMRHQAVDRSEFCTYWVRKESALKATGDGLAVPMTAVQVSAPNRPPVLQRYCGRPELADTAWMYDLRPGPGYRSALTVLGTPAAVDERDGTGLLRGGPR